MQRMKNFLRRREKPIVESEVLQSVLIPSGHHKRFLSANEVEAFFAPYIEYIGNSLQAVYGLNHITRRHRTEKYAHSQLFLDSALLRVEYKISPIEILDKRPSTFYGTLQIKQREIELQKTGELHRRLLDAHPGCGFTLGYNAEDDTQFKIFLSRGEDVICSGKNLLQRMGLEPHHGISYVQSQDSASWKRVAV